MLETHRWARVISGLAAMGVLAVAVAPASAGPPSAPGPGNSPNAQACKDGWQALMRADGTGFANPGECTSYAAKGGTLFNANEAPCLNGGYTNLVTSTGQSFSDQAACVSYVRGGGTLQPKPTGPTLQDCQQELADAGLTEPDNAVYILGTDGDDTLRQIAGANIVICGFGGNDTVPQHDDRGLNRDLGYGDIVLGGAGADSVYTIYGGTFIGGDGNDHVSNIYAGTFNGGLGCDRVDNYSGGLVDLGDQSTC